MLTTVMICRIKNGDDLGGKYYFVADMMVEMEVDKGTEMVVMNVTKGAKMLAKKPTEDFREALL